MSLVDSLSSAVDTLNGFLGQGEPDWKEKLHTALFDGIALKFLESKHSGSFNVQAKSLTGGLPPVVYQSSVNPHSFSISVFTSGKNWAEDRDRLLESLKSGGVKEYSDPFQGKQTVLVQGWEKTESLLDGRYSIFAIELIHAPKVSVGVGIKKKKSSKASLLQDLAATLQNAVDDVTDVIDLVGQPASIITSAVKRVEGELSNAYRKIKGSILSTVGAWEGLFNLFVPGSSGAGNFTRSTFEQIQGVLGEASYEQAMSLSSSLSGRNEGDGTNTKADNDAHLKRFFNTTLLCTAIQRIAETSYTSYDDAMRTKGQIVQRLADAGIQSSVGDYLDSIALQLPRLVSHTPYGVTSTLILSQQFYDSADRATEIRQRNNVPLPMFVPSYPLYLLDR